MEILFIIFIFYIIFSKNTSNNAILETHLRRKGFADIRTLPGFGAKNRICISATKNSMKYLFVKSIPLSSSLILSNLECKSLQEFATKMNFDRIIFYVYAESIPLELTRIASLYNIELWNKAGESNFDTYRTAKPATTSSRLAKTLKPENEVLEHAPNGVIAKDTCHIEPSTSPIVENPKTFFKKKAQRL